MLSPLDLETVVQNICRSTFHTEAIPAFNAGAGPGRHLAASVSISGGWHGAIVLECPETLARQIAAQMFGMEDADLGGADVRDAVGELANMCGGNLKALLPGPSQLSLPSVSEGSDFSTGVPGTKPMLERCFGVLGSPLKVAVLSRD